MSDGILAGTRDLLRVWGVWGRGANLGLPRMSPMFGNRALKTPLYGSEEAPPEILEIDKAVCAVELPERQLLIERYQWHVHWKTACRKRSWTKWKYYRAVESAEWAVHVCLQR